ncbi:MAG: hypothetical protein CMH54_11745 [Myxococcales bacterium]|mgnify:CR=1 FL=1|nr:hypothetical protein [Myxococcales bacterium]
MKGLRHTSDDRKRGSSLPDIDLSGIRVTFVEPPFRLPHDFIDYPTFMNLGLLFNAAVAEQLGANVSVVDAVFSAPSLPLVRGETEDILGMDVPSLTELVLATNPDIIVLHASFFANPRYLEKSFLPSLSSDLAKKAPNTPRILADMFLGGLNYFDYDPEPVAKELGLQVVLQGETDAILPAALQSVSKNSTLEQDIYQRGDRASGQFPLHPDAFPNPAFHLLPMDRYFDIMDEAQRNNLVPEYHAGERILPFMSSRGCPYACIFCTQQVLDLSWRGYSAERLATIMGSLQADYKVDRILFLDDLMNLDGERFRSFTRHMAEIQLAWDAVNGFRADRLNEEVVSNMKKAGNRKVTVSAESADQEVLDRIVRKGLNIEDIDRTAETAHALDYPCQVHYVIGFPGETRTNINTTLLHAARMRRDHGAIALVQYATPVRGTRLFRVVDKEGMWADPDDRERDVSSLFYRDSVICGDDFDPQILKLMRESFEEAMRDLDAMPTILHMDDSTSATGMRALSDLVDELNQLSKPRSRVFLHGQNVLDYPELPELFEATHNTHTQIVGLSTDGSQLLRRTVLEFLVQMKVQWVVLELPSEPDEEFDQRKPMIARAIQWLGRSGIRSSVMASSAVFHSADQSMTLQEWAQNPAIQTLEILVDDPAHTPTDGSPNTIIGHLDALTATSSCTVRVHGLPPCTIDQQSETTDLDERAWRTVTAIDKTGFANTRARNRIDACSSCPIRVGCAGIP